MFESITKTLTQISSSISEIGYSAKFKTAGILGLQTLTVACNLAAPYLLGKSLEDLFVDASDDSPDFYDYQSFVYLAGFGGAVLGSRIFPSISKLISASLKNDTAIVVNSQINRKITELELDYFLTVPMGNFVQMVRQVYDSQDAIPLLLEELYPSLMELAGATAALCYVDWQLGITLLGIDVITLSIAYFGSKPIKALYEQQTIEGRKLFSGVIERIVNYENMHMFSRAEHEIQNGLRDLENFGDNFKKLLSIPECVSLGENITGVVASAGLIVFSLYKQSLKKIPINYFTMILIYSIQLPALISRFNRSMAQLVISDTIIENTTKFLKTPSKVKCPATPEKFEITPKNASISFQNVTFRYNNDVILDKVDIEIKPGSKTAIVGLSGAGKTTLAKLLLRFYEPNKDEGEILINGYNIKNVKLETIRSVVALVPQLLKLPSSTIREAIRYAKSTATDEEIKKILLKVKLNKFATDDGCDLYLMPKLPAIDANQNNPWSKNNYIWIENEQKLYYICSNVLENVKINNIKLFKSVLENNQDNKQYLTGEKIKKYITLNGDHTPNVGLSTRIGERGEKLSGGQIQRVAIGRAIIKEPFIYILDEATSHLDMENAVGIEKLLDEETADITTLVITHNLLTIRDADHIIVLDGGKKIQEGTFDELKAKEEGRFYKLLNSFCILNNLPISDIKGTKRPKSELDSNRIYRDYVPEENQGKQEEEVDLVVEPGKDAKGERELLLVNEDTGGRYQTFSRNR